MITGSCKHTKIIRHGILLNYIRETTRIHHIRKYGEIGQKMMKYWQWGDNVVGTYELLMHVNETRLFPKKHYRLFRVYLSRKKYVWFLMYTIILTCPAEGSLLTAVLTILCSSF